MTERPKLLDLFCKAGGAGTGYHQAGFEVIGVDIEPQPKYPFQFHQADALTFSLSGYDVIHASPPCQAYSVTKSIHYENRHPELIEPVRAKLKESGLPYIIENVVGAPLDMSKSIVLCGAMFNLKVYRHRIFESNIGLVAPSHPKHVKKAIKVGRSSDDPDAFYTVAGHISDIEKCRTAMGIGWMNREELTQAIPPAYTEYIGRQLLESIQTKT